MMNREEIERKVAAASHGDRIRLYEGLSQGLYFNEHAEVRILMPYNGTTTDVVDLDGNAHWSGGSPGGCYFGADGVLYVRHDKRIWKCVAGQGPVNIGAPELANDRQWQIHSGQVLSISGFQHDNKITHIYVNERKLPAVLPIKPEDLQWTVRKSSGVFLMTDVFVASRSAFTEDGVRLCAVPEGMQSMECWDDDIYFRTPQSYYRNETVVLRRDPDAKEGRWHPGPHGIYELHEDGIIRLNGEPVPYKGPLSAWRVCRHGIIVTISGGENQKRRTIATLVVLKQDVQQFDPDAVVA